MPLRTRIIPCLDVAGGRVVKGVNFENLVDAGDPVELAYRYYLEGADEITFLDVNASKEGRGAVLDLVRRTAEKVFIPLTVGGGIRSVDDVAAALEAGADKVSIASAAVSRPNLISEVSNQFGSQVIVVSLDLKRKDSMASGYTVTSHGGSVDENIDAVSWINQVQDLGAGELLVNSIDADGTGQGYDLPLLEKVLSAARVPVIASGGAGSIEDFLVAAESGLDAILAASVFHREIVSISEVKTYLAGAGVLVRAMT
ncbi:imidazole glycerol phosphate synthase [freshwater metagenome]|uniref:imidazole glycerol-phosphate synthase n=1 Tax=freshwater metagenome TaxID=449393 RepID=A0A094QEA5_9ZZZZ